MLKCPQKKERFLPLRLQCLLANAFAAMKGETLLIANNTTNTESKISLFIMVLAFSLCL